MPFPRGRIRGRMALAAAALAASLGASPQGLESVVMPGKVIEGHARVEGQCDSCHKRFDKAAQPRLCLECHKDVAADVSASRGYHGRSGRTKGRECRACHTEHKGREAKIAAFEQAKFDHGETDFLLRDAHAKPGIECRSCHAAGRRWREAPPACTGCHRDDDAHKGSLGPQCADCHNERSWKEPSFEHSKTRFALAGKHAGADCKACHAKGFKDTPRECAACHRKDDAHKGRYGAKCETCHDERSWESRFVHGRATRFALEGKHRLAKCASCHKGPLYGEKLPQRCVACHRADDAHKGSLGEACDKCHDERGWKGSSFDHGRDTRFPLAFKHKAAGCDACHVPGSREKLATTCVACHGEQDPHVTRYGAKCENCHGERDWKELRFDHGRDAGYGLAGRHKGVRCDACHRGELYRDRTPRECVACHRKDDAHRGQLGDRCERCHADTGWKEAPFEHSKSRFPLLGSHLKVECRSCHATARFRDAPRECAGCHDKDDKHRRSLGPACADCHNARSWASWDFDHSRRTRYPLEGAHRKAKCAACHLRPSEGKALAPTACFACHRGDDTHSGAFGVQCERCHGPGGWRDLREGGRGVVPARQVPRGG